MAKTFLGMEIFPKRKSDEEHIEEVREQMARFEGWQKCLTLLQAGMILSLIAMAGWALQEVANLAQQFPGLPGSVWFLAGIICGGILYHIAQLFIHNVSSAAMLRTNRLLIHYYDFHNAVRELGGVRLNDSDPGNSGSKSKD